MGEIHRAFAIARVVPHDSTDGKAYYRCVAAYHHQWCFGTLPLRATRRFLTLIKQKDNAELIRAELRGIQGKYGRRRMKPIAPKLLCPYICFLLGTSWCVDLEDPEASYTSGVSFMTGVLSVGTNSNGGGYNGISIIDITDPLNPSYGFIDGSLQSDTPLNASGYVRAYHPVPNTEEQDRADVLENERSVQETIAALAEENVVTWGMLAEAWPAEYKKKWLAEQAKTNKPEDITSATTTSLSDSVHPVGSFLVPSLTELALKPALNHAIKVGDTQALEELVWMPGKSDAVRSALLRLCGDEKPFPETGLSLLSKVATEIKVDTLDLTGFHLSGHQIKDIASRTETRLQVLKLSGNCFISVDGLSDILRGLRTIRRIWLLDTTISSEDLTRLLTDEPELFYHIETIVHPLFMTMHAEVPYPSAFTFSSISDKQPATFSLPFFTPSSILQSLTDILSDFAYDNKDNAFSLPQPAIVPHIALASVRSEDQKWSERFVHSIPQRPPWFWHGWGFVFDHSRYSEMPNRYAFIKAIVLPEGVAKTRGLSRDVNADEEEPALKVMTYDLESFLKAMAEEGRPEPSGSLVERFVHVLGKSGVSGLSRTMAMEDKNGAEPSKSLFGRFVDLLGMSGIFGATGKVDGAPIFIQKEQDVREFLNNVGMYTAIAAYLGRE